VALLGTSFYVGTIWGSRRGVPLVERYQDWSIGAFVGPSPLPGALVEVAGNPIVRASDVTDRNARFVADPFLLAVDGGYAMLFEVLDHEDGKGAIALATSSDGLAWQYDSVVLEEPFHLSYPYVFQEAGVTYLVPESLGARAVYLYRAERFPHEWVRVRTLLSGRYVDPSLIYWEGRWWLFVGEATNDTLRLFSAGTLADRFVEHPQSPLVLGDKRGGRPAGRILEVDGRLYRCAQDSRKYYGDGVVWFEILTLTPDTYEEAPSGFSLQGDGSGWNAAGMHHFDALQLATGAWLVVSDGWSRRRLMLGGR